MHTGDKPNHHELLLYNMTIHQALAMRTDKEKEDLQNDLDKTRQEMSAAINRSVTHLFVPKHHKKIFLYLIIDLPRYIDLHQHPLSILTKNCEHHSVIITSSQHHHSIIIISSSPRLTKDRHEIVQDLEEQKADITDKLHRIERQHDLTLSEFERARDSFAMRSEQNQVRNLHPYFLSHP